MIELLPAVLSNLQKTGKNIEFCQFLSSIAEDEFPLFLDVASWYSLENTSQIKYPDESMLFWKAMYRFFHGKVLRFMSVSFVKKVDMVTIHIFGTKIYLDMNKQRH